MLTNLVETEGLISAVLTSFIHDQSVNCNCSLPTCVAIDIFKFFRAHERGVLVAQFSLVEISIQTDNLAPLFEQGNLVEARE